MIEGVQEVLNFSLLIFTYHHTIWGNLGTVKNPSNNNKKVSQKKGSDLSAHLCQNT